MQVRQLTGSMRGHIIDLRKDLAEACLSNGTVCEVGKEPNGVTLYPLEGATEPEAAPAEVKEKKVRTPRRSSRR